MHEDDFIKWLDEKKYSESYKDDALKSLNKYVVRDIGINEFREFVNKIDVYSGIMIRVYLNYLMDRGYLTEDDVNKFKKYIPQRKTGIDLYIPDNETVIKAYSKLKNDRDRTVFKVLLFSGIRATEVVKFLNEFDKEKLIINNKVAKYPLNYIRRNKKVYYVYLPKEFALTLEKVYLTEDMVGSLREKSGLAPKYLRKWFYNFLIYHNVPESVADFIEGRSPVSIGSMHYLGKVQQADYWYDKIVDELTKLLP